MSADPRTAKIKSLDRCNSQLRAEVLALAAHYAGRHQGRRCACREIAERVGAIAARAQLRLA